MNSRQFIRFIVTLIILSTSSNLLWAQTDSVSIVIGQKVRLSSKILNEERSIWIHTPPDYRSSVSRYPVVYLLDGEAHFHHVVGTVKHMSQAMWIPQMIIVAIPNVDRLRDFTPIHSLVNALGDIDSNFVSTGGGDNFLRFLREELIPYVDNNYRTQPFRILEGHSLGGMFATHVLESAPELFNSYIIISAAFYGGNFVVVDRVGTFLNNHSDLRKTVYVSVGNEWPHIHKGVDSLVQQLTNHAPKSLHWNFKQYNGEDHLSVPLPSMYDGMRFTFPNWWLDLSDTVRVPNVVVLREHYESISKELGYQILPPEDILNLFGYELLYARKKVNDAIAAFLENVKNYPSSSNVYDSLGEAYMVKGDTKSAIANYERSILLNPDNENGKRMLAKLRAANK